MLPRGLDSVTDAPGSTAPDESVMVPPIAPTPCADTGSVEHAHHASTTTILTKRGAVIVIPSCQRGFVGTVRFEREHTPGASPTAYSSPVRPRTDRPPSQLAEGMPGVRRLLRRRLGP